MAESFKIAEEKKESPFEVTPSPGGPAEGPEAAASVNGKKAFVSWGEKTHKWGTYLSIDWLFNTAAGVSFATWAKFHDKGQKYWSKPIQGALEGGLKSVIKDEARRAASVEKGTMFAGIVWGGMFTIPPLMILESKKVKLKITKALDRLHYGKEAVENDPKFQQAYAAIEDAPKKNFGTGMAARFLALAPLITSILIPKTKEISDKYYYNRVASASESVTKAARKAFGKPAVPANTEKWKYVHESVGLDLGMGIMYAGMHAFFYNALTNIFSKNRHKDDAEARAVHAGHADFEPKPADNNQPEYSVKKPDEKPQQRMDVPASQFTDISAMPSVSPNVISNKFAL